LLDKPLLSEHLHCTLMNKLGLISAVSLAKAAKRRGFEDGEMSKTLTQLKAFRSLKSDLDISLFDYLDRIIADCLDGALSSGNVRPGYCAPVGDDRSRIWPGDWVDATGYARYYSYGWHTGADLNLNKPGWDSDKHRPVYAIAAGEVCAVRTGVPGWATVICIRHHGECLSRYAHCENIAVRQGQMVGMGDYLGNIGNAGGRYPYHLHFDIARETARMLSHPLDWPGNAPDALERVRRDYFNPLKHLRGEVQ